MSGSFQESRSESQNSTYVDPVQQNYLRGLYRQGQGIVNQQLDPNAQQGFALQDQLYGQGQQAQGNLLQAGNVNNNPVLGGQIDQLSTQLNRNFNEQINPTITGEAINAGGLGGGRQGVAQGIAARGTQEAIAQGTSALQSNAYNQSLQANQSAVGNLGQLFQTGTSGFANQFAPLQQQAGILGRPTVLGQGTSSSKTSAGSGGVGG